MANYLYITRAAESWDSEDHPITAEEWLTFAESHPHMRPDSGGGCHDHVYTCLDGSQAWLSWKRGCVEVRGTHVDAADLARLAVGIHARLLGGDGEAEYHPDGTVTEWTEQRSPITPADGPGQGDSRD